MITSSTAGVALGRALTDNLLLLENLASQNLFDTETPSSGGSAMKLVRYRCTASSTSGHWVKWNKLDFASKDSFRYDSGSGNKVYILQEGIYHVSHHFGIYGTNNQ